MDSIQIPGHEGVGTVVKGKFICSINLLSVVYSVADIALWQLALMWIPSKSETESASNGFIAPVAPAHNALQEYVLKDIPYWWSS
jgi:hypothetical protein